MTTPTQQKGVSHDEKKIEAILQSQSKKDINKYFPVLASKEQASKAMKQYAEHYAKQVRMEVIEEVKEIIKSEFGDGDMQLSYTKDIDITELPDGLIAEMNGISKTIKGMTDIIIKALNELE